MTEKRFTTDYYNFIKDDKTYIKDNNVRMTYEQIVDLLNEFCGQIQSQIFIIKGYQDRSELLFEENKRLKNMIMEMFKVSELEIEEKLKRRIQNE